MNSRKKQTDFPTSKKCHICDDGEMVLVENTYVCSNCGTTEGKEGLVPDYKEGKTCQLIKT